MCQEFPGAPVVRTLCTLCTSEELMRLNCGVGEDS